MSYPTSLDDLSASRGTSGAPLSNPNHITHHTNEDTAIQALETKVGIDSSADTSSIDYKLKNTSSIDPGHKHTSSSVTLAITNLTDVNVTSPADGNGLIYNAASSKWINSTSSVADASTSVKGITKLDTAPAVSTSPIAVGVNSTLLTSNSGSAINGTSNKIEDTSDTSATSSASKLLRMDANGKVAEGATYFDYQSFTSNGTWTKPTGLSGNELIHVQLWGGGAAGGGVPATSSVGGSGGGGGAFSELFVRASDLGSTVAVTIAANVAGTTSSGAAGNNSTFGTLLTAYGGAGGLVGASSTSEGGGGGGGGAFGAGNAGSGGTGGTGGGPAGSAAGADNAGFGGGGGGSSGGAGGASVYGGGGGGGVGSGTSGGAGGQSLRGGGGGGGGGSSPASGGVSAYGGAGGAGAANGNGTAGTAPAGGGGGAGSSSAAHSGGAGARGECRVWVLI